MTDVSPYDGLPVAEGVCWICRRGVGGAWVGSGPGPRIWWARRGIEHAQHCELRDGNVLVRPPVEGQGASPDVFTKADGEPSPIPMLLWCPVCHGRHVDVGQFAEKRHHTHACQHCGVTWRPAIVATVGVQFLPGFKDGAT